MPTNLTLGGYVLSTPTARDAWQSDSLPDPFMTISSCLQRGVPEPEFIDWYTDRQEAELVRASWSGNLDLIAVGMREQESAELTAGRQNDKTADDFIYGLLNQRLPMPTTAAALGYEIVGVEGSLQFHSWHCHNYLDEAQRELGVRINQHGMFDQHRDAEQVRDWMLSQPVEKSPKPVPWVVVALYRCQ
jgi:hypothetical protein